MSHSYTGHNVQKQRLPITKSHNEGTLLSLSLQTLQLQLYTETVTRLMEWYRDNLWAKDRLGAINLPVRICLHHTPIITRKDYHASTFMIIRIKHNPTIWALELSTWKELHKMVTSHTDQYTKRLSCINLHDHRHQAKPNHLGVGVINMERATLDGYITHRSIHEKIIMHQPSWLYASSITQPSWRWRY